MNNRNTREIQDILKTKYNIKLQATSRQYLANYVTYIIGPNTTISSAQSQLSILVRKVLATQTSLKGISTKEKRFQFLLQALLQDYTATKATIDSQSKSITLDKGLTLLQEREVEMSLVTYTILVRQGNFKKFNQRNRPKLSS